MRIVFMGTPDFAANVLQALMDAKHEVVLVVSQPDRAVGRKRVMTKTPVKNVAEAHGISVFQPEQIKVDYTSILEVNADIIVTAAYGQIVPKAVLDAPRLGCINVHASLLPKYRGGAPIHQAIIDGEPETGVTIMYMEETMDTGDIISQKAIPILESDDVGSMFEKLSVVGADLLTATLPAIENGTAGRAVQDATKATYASNIKREQEKIKWRKTLKEVYNQIRGLHPWPVAYSVIDETQFKVFRSEKAVDIKSAGEPGTILGITADGIEVTCGDGGVLRLIDVQIAGKKRIAMKDLLNGSHPFEMGKKLG